MLTADWTKLRQLSSADRWVLFRAALLLPMMHAGLALVGYYRLRRILERLIPQEKAAAQGNDTELLQEARRIAHLASIAARRGPYRATCLRRSLVLWWLLRGQGIPAKLYFGVRKEQQHLEAHAWVEYEGSVLNDQSDTRERFHALGEDLPPTTLGL